MLLFLLNECLRQSSKQQCAGAGPRQLVKVTVKNSDMGVFAPQKLANAINQSFSLWRGELVYQHTV